MFNDRAIVRVSPEVVTLGKFPIEVLQLFKSTLANDTEEQHEGLQSLPTRSTNQPLEKDRILRENPRQDKRALPIASLTKAEDGLLRGCCFVRKRAEDAIRINERLRARRQRDVSADSVWRAEVRLSSGDARVEGFDPFVNLDAVHVICVRTAVRPLTVGHGSVPFRTPILQFRGRERLTFPPAEQISRLATPPNPVKNQRELASIGFHQTQIDRLTPPVQASQQLVIRQYRVRANETKYR
jgi:hypothetical protein